MKQAGNGLAGLLQPDFMGYLEQFTDTPATVGGQEVESRIRRPFLKRTMITPGVEDGPPEERELAIMNGTQMRNGLECKLTTSTSKVLFTALASMPLVEYFSDRFQDRVRGHTTSPSAANSARWVPHTGHPTPWPGGSFCKCWGCAPQWWWSFTY